MLQEASTFPFPVNTHQTANPEFNKLLQKLSLHLSEDLSIKCVSDELNNSQATLKREKKRFVEKRKLMRVCNSFSYQPSADAKVVSQAIALSKLENMVPVRHCGKDVSLAGITKLDLQHVAQEAGVTDCQQILTPHIEADLHKTKSTLCEFISPARACTTLAATVENKVHGNMMKARKLHQLTSEEVSLSTQYIVQSSEVLELYKVFSKTEAIQNKKSQHAEKAAYLSARCSKITLMMDSLEAKILIDTYSKDKVQALKQISHHIKKRKQSLECERANHQHTLDAYLSLGEDFIRLVDKYSEKQSVLENNIWALQNLG